MAITHVVIQYPRYEVLASKLKTIWNSPVLNSYSSVYKLGIDEDATTLAVNAILELVDAVGKKPQILHVCSTNQLDRAVFLEATGLFREDVKFHPYGEFDAVIAIEETLSQKETAFLIVDVPEGKDEVTDAYCTGTAVAGFSNEGKGLEIKETIEMPGFLANESRLDGRTFSPNAENTLIETIASSVKEEDIVFANVANLRTASRRINNIYIDGSKRAGFAGITTNLISLFHFLKENGRTEKDLSLIAMEEKGGIGLRISAKNPPIILTSTPTISLNVATYMLRKEMRHGNISIPQGAYISTPVYFGQKEARYRLRSATCENCGLIHFPPRKICKNCGNFTKPSGFLSRKGKLYTYTQILKGAAPTEFDLQQRLEGEYCVGIIEFEEGPRVISQLTDVNIDDLEVGDEMKMVFRKIYHQNGTDRYGYKFTKVV